MYFLIRKVKAQTAHLWDDGDTYCRMYSTGGLNKKKYNVVANTQLDICTMCNNVFEQYSGYKYETNRPDGSR